MNIKIFKLVSGEEIITKVLEDSSLQSYIVIEKPRSIQPVPQGPNQFGIGLLPYIITNADGQIKLYKAAISGECDAPSDVEKVYLQQTTNIQIASSLMEKA